MAVSKLRLPLCCRFARCRLGGDEAQAAGGGSRGGALAELGMISAVYIINSKGDIILFRKYRDDVTRNAAKTITARLRPR